MECLKQKNRTLLMCLILLFFANLSNGQTYILGRYEINPAKKTVGVLKPFIVSFDDGGHGHGEHFVLDSTINYDNTTLFVIGNDFFFKEHINQIYPNFDVNTFKVISVSEDFCRNRAGVLSRDKNYIYVRNYYRETINISNYEVINDFIYRHKVSGALHFLSRKGKLEGIQGVTLDAETVQHIASNYFMDKNGLYLLGPVYDENWRYIYDVKLEDSKGKEIISACYKLVFTII